MSKFDQPTIPKECILSLKHTLPLLVDAGLFKEEWIDPVLTILTHNFGSRLDKIGRRTAAMERINEQLKSIELHLTYLKETTDNELKEIEELAKSVCIQFSH